MDAFELKIGNIVKHGFSSFMDGRYTIPDGKMIDIIADNCEPMPLTDEWLLNFGLQMINGVTGRYSYQNGYASFGDDCYIRNSGTNDPHFTIVTLDYTTGQESLVTTNLRYVHQLQNLYLALTGTELLLKRVGENI